MALIIQKDRVVQMAYRLVDSDGRLLEEKTPEEPYEYLHGHGQINEAVERAVEGKTSGFRAEVHLTPREGYGEYDPSLVVEVPRAHFPMNVDLQAGMKFNTTGPDGRAMIVRVIETDGQTVTIDGNHPLAGLELVFDLRVLDVREASPEEADIGQLRGGFSKTGSESIH
jgi:FKBP-type peptidyl-prolyl cis-trans isomerase SlyD